MKPEPVLPLTVGAGNCVAMTGMSWPHTRRVARKLGIAEIRIGERKVLLPAAELLAALRALAELQQAAAEPADVRAVLMAELGLEEAVR